MNKRSTGFYLFTFLLLAVQYILHINTATAQDNDTTKKKVYAFTLDQDIFPAALRLVKNALSEAEAMKADYVLIRLNTYGGELASGDSMRALFLNAKPITLVWIQHNAASAGALISIACDSIYMRADAKIGAASVVNEDGEVMADKYQSYMRGMMRSTATQTGRDPKIAEGMVSPNNYLPGIADSGRVITLIATEAVQHGYCNGIAETEDAVLKLAHIDNYEIVERKTTWVDSLLSILLNPMVNGILLLLILGGIYFEFQHPGAAFPILTSIVAAVFYFAPLYLDGLASHWEILIFVVGVGLLAVEIFVTPGFGIPGISGIILIISGLTLSLLRNVNFDFSMETPTDILMALFRVVVPLGLAFFLFLAFGKNLFKSRMMRGFVLNQTQEAKDGHITSKDDLEKLIKKKGIAATSLRPAGNVIIDGERYDAMAETNLISIGEAVVVIAVSGNILVVRRAS